MTGASASETYWGARLDWKRARIEGELIDLCCSKLDKPETRKSMYREEGRGIKMKRMDEFCQSRACAAAYKFKMEKVDSF